MVNITCPLARQRFFTDLSWPLPVKTAGYSGLLVAAPTVLYEIIAYVVPGLTKSERTFLAPVVFGSSILFYFGCAALNACSLAAGRNISP